MDNLYHLPFSMSFFLYTFFLLRGVSVCLIQNDRLMTGLYVLLSTRTAAGGAVGRVCYSGHVGYNGQSIYSLRDLEHKYAPPKIALASCAREPYCCTSAIADDSGYSSEQTTVTGILNIVC